MGFLSLIRLIAIVVLVWMLYRGIKNFMARRADAKARKSVDPATGQEIEMMVEDPQCHTFLPQKDAIHLYHKGQDLFFCSEKCRDEYREAQKNH